MNQQSDSRDEAMHTADWWTIIN